MRYNKNGDIEFLKNGVIYRFEKLNYKRHILKRPIIASGLKEIEDTILRPDCITWGPSKKYKENFYKVISYKDSGNIRHVIFWKIPVYFNKNRRLAKIATCIYSFSPNYYVINSLETIKWKRPNSQI